MLFSLGLTFARIECEPWPTDTRSIAVSNQPCFIYAFRKRSRHYASRVRLFDHCGKNNANMTTSRLCHIVRGPHDQQFHALWNELRDEWGTLQIKGYTGEGFLGKGRLVGGNYIPREELRRRARAEAEMERARRKARGESSRRLGGSVMSGGIRDAIATATLRRNNAIVDDNCGTGTKAGDRAAQDALLNGFRSKEEMAEADHLAIQQALFDLMEVEEGRKLEQEAASSQPPTTVAPQPPSEGLTWDAENGLQPVGGYYGPGPSMWSPTQPTSPAPYPQTRVAPELDRHGRPLSRLVSEASNKRAGNNAPTDRSWSRSQATTAASQGSSSQPWDCPWCTLINTANTSNCIACEAARPTPNNPQTAKAPAPSHKKLTKAQAPVTLGWNCLNCGTFMEHQWWTCSMCGLMKRAS
jgi:hypothetical protein